jgi:hypothetical protein
VCSVEDEWVTDAAVAPDGSGGAVLSWTDSRTLAADAVYANRVDGGGVVRWAADGVVVAATEDIDYLQSSIVSDGSGGAIVAYVEAPWYTEEPAIHASRFSDAGQRLWGAVLCTVDEPACVMGTWSASDAAGGAVVAWRHSPDGVAIDIHARRVSAGGAPLWSQCGVQVSTFGDAGLYGVDIVPDGAGGAIIAWHDRTGPWYVLTQHVDAGGGELWQPGGLNLVPEAVYPVAPALASDGSGGGVYAWRQTCPPWCVYAQRVSDMAIFGDDFESGDTSAWSVTSP